MLASSSKLRLALQETISFADRCGHGSHHRSHTTSSGEKKARSFVRYQCERYGKRESGRFRQDAPHITSHRTVAKVKAKLGGWHTLTSRTKSRNLELFVRHPFSPNYTHQDRAGTFPSCFVGYFVCRESLQNDMRIAVLERVRVKRGLYEVEGLTGCESRTLDWVGSPAARKMWTTPNIGLQAEAALLEVSLSSLHPRDATWNVTSRWCDGISRPTLDSFLVTNGKRLDPARPRTTYCTFSTVGSSRIMQEATAYLNFSRTYGRKSTVSTSCLTVAHESDKCSPRTYTTYLECCDGPSRQLFHHQ